MEIQEMSDKVVDNSLEAIKSHPGITALLGLGISWLIADSMMKQKSLNVKMQEQTKEYVEEKFPEVKEAAAEGLESLKSSVSSLTRGSQSAFGGVSNFMNEYPVITGILGLSAGLILGVVTSGVLKRPDLVEQIRRGVVEKTGQIGHKLNKTKEKAGHVFDAVRNAAKEEAERQELIH